MPEQYELRRNSIALYIVTELSADDDTNGFLGKSIYFGSEVNQNEVDIIASIGGNKTAFVFVDTVNQEEIRNKIKRISSQNNKICIVFFDNALRNEISKVIPQKCGMLCYLNAFGFGMIFQLFREWS